MIKLEKYILELEESSHAQEGGSTRRNRATTPAIEMYQQPSQNTSYSEQNWVKASCKTRSKNSVHWLKEKPPFTSNYVYDRSQPKHIKDRVLTKDKRQAIVLGSEWKTKQLSTGLLIEKKVKEINKEQNSRNLIFNNRQHEARLEEIRHTMTEQRARHQYGESDSSKRSYIYLPRTNSIEDLRSRMSLTEKQEEIPKPIEEAVKEHKRVLTRMATTQLLGTNSKSSRFIFDPEVK